MQTLENGIVVPTNSDPYNLTDDLAGMGDTTNVVLPVLDAAARDALTKRIGLTVQRRDLGMLIEMWDGTTWRRATWTHAEYANSAVLNSPIAAGGQLGPFYQTFPVGRFSVPPIITLAGSNARHGMSATNVTADGFDLYIRNDTNTDTVTGAIIYYTARQMTPTTAAG